MTMKKVVKNYMGAAVGMGVGNTVLGAMGQGAIASKMSGATNMMGVGMTAGMGMEVLKQFDAYGRKVKRRSN